MQKKIISIILAVMTALPIFSTRVLADNSTIVFSDVDASTKEGAAIYKLAQNGIVNGNGDGTFSPNNFVTRAELCKMVNNIWNLTEPAEDGFKDVTEDKWYYTHVLIGKKAGYIKGYDDGTFKGGNYVTREQASAIICRISGIESKEFSGTIADAVSGWALEDVKKILANNLISLEAGNTFRATENMKRGELAKVLSNFVNDKSPDNSSDGNANASGNISIGGTTNGSGNGSGNGNSGPSSPTVDYSKQNETIVANLTTAKDELTKNRELFTTPEKEIIDLIISVMTSLINDKSKYIISTETVYTHYSDKIVSALDKYSAFDKSAKNSFVSKISRLNSDVFNFIQTFFGVNFSDIEDIL